MKRKRWLGLPMVILVPILLVCLLTSGIFAAFAFTGIAVNVEVDEPLAVQYKLDYVVHDTQNPEGRPDTSGWLAATGLEGVIPAYFSAGDSMTLYLRINNRANSELTVSTIITDTAGVFNWSGFPQSQTIPVSNGYDFGSSSVTDENAADWASGGIPLSVKGDAPPGTYSLTFEFTRQ